MTGGALGSMTLGFGVLAAMVWLSAVMASRAVEPPAACVRFRVWDTETHAQGAERRKAYGTMAPMRVGIVCPYSLDVAGGVQAHVLDLARASDRPRARRRRARPGRVSPPRCPTS